MVGHPSDFDRHNLSDLNFLFQGRDFARKGSNPAYCCVDDQGKLDNCFLSDQEQRSESRGKGNKPPMMGQFWERLTKKEQKSSLPTSGETGMRGQANASIRNSIETAGINPLDAYEIVESLADGEHGPVSMAQSIRDTSKRVILRGTYPSIARGLTRDVRKRIAATLEEFAVSKSDQILPLDCFGFEPEAYLLYPCQPGRLLYQIQEDPDVDVNVRLETYFLVLNSSYRLIDEGHAQLKMIDPKRIWIQDDDCVKYLPDSLEWPDGVAVSIGEIDLRREIDAEDLIFAAPEQLMQTGRLGGGVESTFQYRLGVLFYKLVLGINPFGDEPELLKLMARGSVRPRAKPPSSFYPALKPFDHALSRMLDKNTLQRFESLSVAVESLRECYRLLNEHEHSQESGSGS
jgi:hypothetical protein